MVLEHVLCLVFGDCIKLSILVVKKRLLDINFKLVSAFMCTVHLTYQE